MKKWIVFLLLPLLFFTYQIKSPKFYDLLDKNFSWTYCFVFKENVSTENSKIVKCGKHFFVSFEEKDFNFFETKKPLFRQASFEGKVEDFLRLSNSLNLKNAEFQNFDDIKSVIGFFPLLSDFRIVNGKKINVQIVFSNSKITLGYPMIFTGF